MTGEGWKEGAMEGKRGVELQKEYTRQAEMKER